MCKCFELGAEWGSTDFWRRRYDVSDSHLLSHASSEHIHGQGTNMAYGSQQYINRLSLHLPICDSHRPQCEYIQRANVAILFPNVSTHALFRCELDFIRNSERL